MAKKQNNRSFVSTQREDVIILQLFINFIFSYIAGFLNQVRNVYFIVVLIPIVIPVVFTTMVLYGTKYTIKIMGVGFCVLTTIALIILVLFRAPIWYRIMV